MRGVIRFLALVTVLVCFYHHYTKYGLPFGLGKDNRIMTIDDGGRRVDLKPLVQGPGRTLVEFTADW